MRRTGFPVAPLVLGAVLGPLTETQFRRALTLAEGDWTVFVTRPVSAAILALAALALFGPLLMRLVRTPAPADGEADVPVPEGSHHAGNAAPR
jgi:putative tricarboxylic transport membrane protein